MARNTNGNHVGGSKCIIGCDRVLAPNARSNICPVCRARMYSKKDWTPQHLETYREQLRIRATSAALMNSRNPGATVTIGTHKLPKQIFASGSR
jgi:hypothetical protein